MDTGDLDIEDMAVIMRTVLIFAHIPIGIGIHIIIHIGETAGCRDIGNMVIGFPVIMCLAIKEYIGLRIIPFSCHCTDR